MAFLERLVLQRLACRRRRPSARSQAPRGLVWLGCTSTAAIQVTVTAVTGWRRPPRECWKSSGSACIGSPQLSLMDVSASASAIARPGGESRPPLATYWQQASTGTPRSPQHRARHPASVFQPVTLKKWCRRSKGRTTPLLNAHLDAAVSNGHRASLALIQPRTKYRRAMRAHRQPPASCACHRRRGNEGHYLFQRRRCA